jgi:uncharacterized repeat protein (TIGR03843 family)
MARWAAEVSDRETTDRLRTAPLELVGRFADASNATLLVRLLDVDPRGIDELADELGREPDLEDLDPDHLGVYKPARGEAPLWDFPAGTLHLREVAAYEVSAALGWDLVPPTVLRDDGPLGPGSLQRFVPHDPAEHYFALLEGAEALHDQLRAMVVYDLVVNNADRKGGHVLLERGSRRGPRIRLIDHGVTFHTDPKLRTVAWHFAGQPVPPRRRADVLRMAEALAGGLGLRLAGLLAPAEISALRERIVGLAERDTLPDPTGPRATPWPLL